MAGGYLKGLISEFDNSDSQNDKAQSTDDKLIVSELTKEEYVYLITPSLLLLVSLLTPRAGEGHTFNFSSVGATSHLFFFCRLALPVVGFSLRI